MKIMDEWDMADLRVQADQEDKPAVFKVSGCGVSAIGPWTESMNWIASRIIDHGGIPTVERL